MATIVFTTTGFSLLSATSPVAARVRARFTDDPKQSDPALADDALNPANWTLTGPASVSVQSAAVVIGDPQAIDLNLDVPLVTGSWTLTVANVKTPAGTSLSSPTAYTFAVTATSNRNSLTAGAEEDTAARVIRKHLSPAMAGDNWDAVIEGLSTGDDTNWDNARLAFDQLFLGTASEKYLDRLAANIGLSRPQDVGLSDEDFRDLAITLSTRKVTLDSLREIMRVFFGRDALQAYAETDLEAPYDLQDGLDLSIKIDEGEEITHIFDASGFAVAGAVSALEVAAALTKAFIDNGIKGFAVSTEDPLTGNDKVRIYSGSLGLKSFVRVTGGTAQPVLRFPTFRSTYDGTVDVGDNYDWSFSTPEPGVTRMSLTTVGILKLDVATVEAGDYLVVGEAVGDIEPGTYQVLDVDIEWNAGDYIQTIDVEDLDYVGNIVQTSNYDYQWFSPTKQTTLDGERSVVVAQTVRGQVNVRMPATSAAVSRGVGLAAYTVIGPSNEIKRFYRTGAGTLHIDFEDPIDPVISTGGQVLLEGLRSSYALPWVSPGDYGTVPAVAYSDASHVTCWSGMQVPPAPLGFDNGSATTLLDGSVLFVGGLSMGGFGYDTSVRLIPVGTSTVADGSEAEGATRRTYQWENPALTMNQGRQQHGASLMLDGRVMVTGGYDSTSALLSHVEATSPAGWVVDTSLEDPVADHLQVTLQDGRVLMGGGVYNDSTATPNCYTYDPATLLWTQVGNLLTARARAPAIVMPDGRVMVIGGAAMAHHHPADSSTVAYWQFEEASGATIYDYVGGYNLTKTAGTLLQRGSAGYAIEDLLASGVGHASIPTLFQSRTWTVDFCLINKWNTQPVDSHVLAYAGDDETQAKNSQFYVGVLNSGELFWGWEYGAGLDATTIFQSTATIAQMAGNVDMVHVALRSEGNTVDLFINGVYRESMTEAQGPDGGGSAQWYVGNHPQDPGVFYEGMFDEVRVSDIARTDRDIMESYLRMRGRDAPNSTYPLRSIALNTTEFYDPNTDTWSYGPPMTFGRIGHSATLLDDGRVLVIGGFGKRPSDPLPPWVITFKNYWPNSALLDAEIYDPATGRWHPAGRTKTPWAAYMGGHPSTLYFPDRNQVIVGQHQSLYPDYDNAAYKINDFESIEVFNTTTNKWTSHFLRNEAELNHGAVVGDYGIFWGPAGMTAYEPQLFIPALDQISGGGLNGLHTITDWDTDWIEVETPGHLTFASNVGEPGGLGGRTAEAAGFTVQAVAAPWPGRYPIETAQRNTNVVTLTLSTADTFTTAGLEVGQLIWVNSGSSDYASGRYEITGLTDTTIDYTEAGGDLADLDVEMTIHLPVTASPTAVLLTAPVGDTDAPGPYVFDPVSGLSITGDTDTLATALQKSTQVDRVVLASNADFPDEPGYIVFGFGTSTQSSPVRYLEKVDTDLLLLDHSYRIEADYPVGTSVTRVVSREPYQPDGDPSFWATGSASGRIAAQRIVGEAAAAGFDIDFDVVYPGDRGLGGEGYPTEGDGKLSDAVKVWGGDDEETE